MCVRITGVDIWKAQALSSEWCLCQNSLLAPCLCVSFSFHSVLSDFLCASLAPRPHPSSPPPPSSLQPSSPGDYYSSVESDLKVELTEKLFALDTEGNGDENTEVCFLFLPSLCKSEE